MPPKIAITMGDPAGIGPEITVLAHAREELFSRCRPVVYGDPAILRRAARVTGVPLAVVGEDGETGPGRIAVAARSSLDPRQVPFGRPSLPGSVAMAGYIRSAARDVLSGKAAAVVTCPVTKEGLKAAGVPFPGHTEFLADLCGGADVVMRLRVWGVAGFDTLRFLVGRYEEPTGMRLPLRDAECRQCHDPIIRVTLEQEEAQEGRGDTFHAITEHRTVRTACVACHTSHTLGEKRLQFIDRKIVLPICRRCHERMGEEVSG